MTDLTTIPTAALIALAETWLEQLEYSNGVHWPLRTVAGDTAPGDVFRELVERVKAQTDTKFTGGEMCRQCGKNPKFEDMGICRPCFDWQNIDHAELLRGG